MNSSTYVIIPGGNTENKIQEKMLEELLGAILFDYAEEFIEFPGKSRQENPVDVIK